MEDPSKDAFLIVNPMKIMINLNNNKNEYVPFTYDMLDHPDMTNVKVKDSTYPYFSASVKYPFDLLYYKDYSYILEFFFGRETFKRVLRKQFIDYVDENAIYKSPKKSTLSNNTEELDVETEEMIKLIGDNTKYNINCMLFLLFPIRLDFNYALSNTYENNIRGELNTNLFFFDPYQPLYEGKTGMLKVNGNTYIIQNVIWLNDLIHHPIYKNFLIKYNESINSRKSYSGTVNKIYSEKIYELIGFISLFYEEKYKK